MCVYASHSVMSNSLWPHGLYPTRLFSPWNSPGKNTGVGCHTLSQGIFLTQEGSNLGLLHCRRILYRLSHQGSLNNPTNWWGSSCMLDHAQDVMWSVRSDRGGETQQQQKLLQVRQIREGSLEERVSQQGWKCRPEGSSRGSRGCHGPQKRTVQDREPTWPGWTQTVMQGMEFGNNSVDNQKANQSKGLCFVLF